MERRANRTRATYKFFFKERSFFLDRDFKHAIILIGFSTALSMINFKEPRPEREKNSAK